MNKFALLLWLLLVATSLEAPCRADGADTGGADKGIAAALRGLSTVSLSIDVSPDLATAGLSVDDMRISIDVHLREAGIAVSKDLGETVTVGGHSVFRPYPVVSVNARGVQVQSQDVDVYTYDIMLSVAESVLVSRTNENTVATVWSTDTFGYGDSNQVEALGTSVSAEVDKLLADYAIANPKKESLVGGVGRGVVVMP